MTLKCPNCGSTDLYYDPETGELICRKCGYVIETTIDVGKEWREFSLKDAETKRRAGSPTSLVKLSTGLSTEIGNIEDLYKLSEEERAEFMRLKKWQQRTTSSLERNLKIAMQELKRVTSQLNLPQTVEEEAGKIYLEAAEKGLIRGRSIETVVAACVYIACRKLEIPVTFEEIAQVANVNKKELGRTYRYIIRQLKIKILPISPVEYVHRFGALLNLPPEVIAKAVEIVEKARELDLTSGRGPQGIAAAALYIAATMYGIRKTQREIAEVAGVTEVTIRNRYKELVEKLGLQIEETTTKRRR